MKTILLLTLTLTLTLFVVGGCAGPSRVEMDYGTSHKFSKFNQILNPQAEKNLEPVEGLDAGAAQKAVEKYRKGFEKTETPSAAPVTLGIIGVGGK